MKTEYNKIMLKVGDKVRFSNEYIAKHSILAPGQRRGRNWFKRRRGKNKVMTVLKVEKGQWDWRTKRYAGDIIMTDELVEDFTPGKFRYKLINAHWLRFVRRDT